MTLSALLLGSNGELDAELDSLFKAPVPLASPTTSPRTSSKNKKTVQPKRKLDAAEHGVAEGTLKKRVKFESSKRSKKSTSNDAPTLKAETEGASEGREESNVRRKKGKEKAPTDSVFPNHGTGDRLLVPASRPLPGNDTIDDDEGQPGPLVHESLMQRPKTQTGSTSKQYVPNDETPDMRDQRTIFVGNLPLEVLSKKSMKKQLQRHILSFVPSAKIESVRFRSIPFQIPTSKLPTSDDEGALKPKGKAKKADVREHTKDRVSCWREKQEDKDEANVQADEKKYLTPAQKKKIAYIHQDFHSSADSVNAYLVFAHPADPSERSVNLPPLPPTMDPYQAALQAAVKANGSIFMERMIRVDSVAKMHLSAKTTAIQHEADPRLSIFIGNLDFASKAEDLRAFFEGLISTERGPPIEDENIDEDDPHDVPKKPLTWVTRVRIIHDKDTQVGKGFAYVQFTDKECVDEVLAMEEAKLKFAKRKLRVQRCKSIPGGAKVEPTQSSSPVKTKKHPPRPIKAVVIPKADPSLGEKISGLSKEDRKKVKSTNPARVARRLAKKKARMGMKPGVGSELLKKQRKRVRSQTKRT